MAILIFILKSILFIVGTLFLGVFIGTSLGVAICKILGIPIAPRGDAYYVGKGWFSSVLHGNDEALEISKVRHRINEISILFGFIIIGLLLFVGLFTGYPMSPAGVFDYLKQLIS